MLQIKVGPGANSIKRSSFGASGGESTYCESRGLLCRRTEANAQFKDCESMLNLILCLGYNDFKTGVSKGYPLVIL